MQRLGPFEVSSPEELWVLLGKVESKLGFDFAGNVENTFSRVDVVDQGSGVEFVEQFQYYL